MNDKLSLTNKINEQIPYGIIYISEESRIEYLNKKMSNLFLDEGLSLRIGDPLSKLGKFPELFLSIKESLNLKKDFSREFNLSEDNTIQIDSINSKEKDFCGLICCFYPVSHFKRSEKNQRKFVANVSHELKTPLTSIIGYVETLMDNKDVEESIRDKFYDIIYRQSQRLSTIISDLLTLSQLDKEEASAEVKEYFQENVVSVVKNSLSSFEIKAKEKNVKMIYSGPESILLKINDGLIEQAISNLIDNALKFTPDNGEIKILLQEVNNWIELNIDDQGPGIPEKYLNRIFERFFSVDKGRSRKLGGSGLGLSIVKHIVLNHEGDVFVKNKINESGSIFTIRLPKK
tara:strand:+ start:59 stop:1096 length:1038 start_codon:yes stop_codon:yes gene_type:complete